MADTKQFLIKFGEYATKAGNFNPEHATDEERGALLAEGAQLIKSVLDPPRELTMEEIIDQEARGVNTAGARIPMFSGTQVDADLVELDAMIVSQNASRLAFAKGIGSIVKAGISIAAKSAGG